MPSCIELANCQFSGPIDFFMKPYTELLGPFAYLMFAGLFAGIIALWWHRRRGNAPDN